MTHSNHLSGDTRSASEVVGIALLTGIVFIGVSVILVTGLSQVGDSQDSIETGQAEQALTEFDSEAVRVATASTASQQIDLGLRGNDGTLDVEEASGNITIIYNDESLSTDPQLNVTRPLGTVVYENGDTTVGYQGGGVWRSDGPNSTIVSPPEITYEGNTLTLPVIESKDGGSVHSDVEITPTGPSEQLFPDPAAENLTNKVNTGTLVLVIESRYYEAWGEYFDTETDAVVLPGQPEEGKVTVVFRGSSFSINEDAGIISTSGPGEVFISGTSGSQDQPTAYIDSYDSSEGSYSETEESTGVLKAAGDVTLSGNSAIKGDTESEGAVILKGDKSEITRDVLHEDGVYVKGSQVTNSSNTDQIGGEIIEGANVPRLYPLPVRSQVDAIKTDNDNDQTAGINDNDQLTFNDSNARELGPGTYYLDEIDLDNGENLFLDAKDGKITIGVNNYVSLEDGKIEVKGNPSDSVVQVYIASRGSSGNTVPVGTGSTEGAADHFYVGKGDKITVDKDASPRFQVIGPADFTGGVRGTSSKNNTEMTGVVFAPTLDSDDKSEFTIRDAEFFGAVVTGNLSIDNKAEVHFDRGIIGVGVPVPEGALLDFLHVTRHEIEVKGS